MFEVGQIVLCDAVGQLSGGQRLPFRQCIEQIKVQGDILRGKALCFEGMIERIVQNTSAVYGQKYIFTASILTKGHTVPNPAFDSAALVVIGTGTFLCVFFPRFEAVYIKFPHIVTDFCKAFDKFVVCHRFSPSVF